MPKCRQGLAMRLRFLCCRTARWPSEAEQVKPVPDEDPPVTPLEVTGHPKHTGRFWFDFAAASAAIFISVVSLVVAMTGEQTQRELLAASSWPFLQAEELRDAGINGVDVIKVRNEGVGPAKVFTFEVFYDGHPSNNAYDLLHSCCACRPNRTRDAGNSRPG